MFNFRKKIHTVKYFYYITSILLWLFRCHTPKTKPSKKTTEKWGENQAFPPPKFPSLILSWIISFFEREREFFGILFCKILQYSDWERNLIETSTDIPLLGAGVYSAPWARHDCYETPVLHPHSTLLLLLLPLLLLLVRKPQVFPHKCDTPHTPRALSCLHLLSPTEIEIN